MVDRDPLPVRKIFFVGVLILALRQGDFELPMIRHAIAAALVATFLFLLSVNIFFALDGGKELSDAGQKLLDALISLMTIVFFFYFVTEGAAQGVVRYQDSKNRGAGPNEPEQPQEPEQPRQ